jgi:hypothetical protein
MGALLVGRAAREQRVERGGAQPPVEAAAVAEVDERARALVPKVACDRRAQPPRARLEPLGVRAAADGGGELGEGRRVGRDDGGLA